MRELLIQLIPVIMAKPWVYFLPAFGAYLLICAGTLLIRNSRARHVVQGLVFALLMTPMPYGVDQASTLAPAWSFMLEWNVLVLPALFWMGIFFLIGYSLLPALVAWLLLKAGNPVKP